MLQKGACWATNIPCQSSCTKPNVKRLVSAQQVVLKPDAGDPGKKNIVWRCSKAFERKISPGTTKPVTKKTKPKPSWTGSFLKALQSRASIFATLPCDKKKLRMTTYHCIKTMLVLHSLYVFLALFSMVFHAKVMGQRQTLNAYAEDVTKHTLLSSIPCQGSCITTISM